MYKTLQKSIGSAPSDLTPTGELFPRPLRLHRLTPGLAVLALALLMLLFTDHSYHFIYRISRYFPDQYIAATTQFVSSFTVFAIVALIWIMDRPRRATIAVLLVALALAGAGNGAIKLLAGRARPSFSLRLDDASRAKLALLQQRYPKAGIRTDGRDYWLGPLARPVVRGADAFNSFPSGHSAAAFAIAAFLIVLYPRARWLWLLTAAGCAVARVATRRHFPEDVLFGSALGWLLAQWAFSWSWPPALGRLIQLRIEK